ncbi:MAG: radical SAM-associated putative lipoprotein [Treponemataceae bacterium]|nr:radical SAM-associated putative lipoprotein [Treponemataceae bacterium]
MAKKIKTGFVKLLSKILQVLGITSLFSAFGCIEPVMYGSPMVCMYGVPGNFFTVDGTITDAQNNPIQGIKVNAKRVNSEQSDDEDGLHNSADVFTNENGAYHLAWNDYDPNSFQFIISAEDIDGAENGSYDNKTINVSFSNSNLTGHTGFGNGEYEISNKNIQLDDKQTTPPESSEN